MALLKEDGLEAHTQVLTSEVKIFLTKTQQAEYKAIDKAATEYKRNAEMKCRKFHAGAVLWCPQVSCAINRILYWKGLLSCNKAAPLEAQSSGPGPRKQASINTWQTSPLTHRPYRTISANAYK